jgi:hypothetical protein
LDGFWEYLPGLILLIRVLFFQPLKCRNWEYALIEYVIALLGHPSDVVNRLKDVSCPGIFESLKLNLCYFTFIVAVKINVFL